MSIANHELPVNSPRYDVGDTDNDLKRNRRAINKAAVGGIGAFVATAVVGGSFLKSRSEQSPTREDSDSQPGAKGGENPTKAVTLEQSLLKIENLPAQRPDLFPSGIDPDLLLDKVYEQRVQAGSIAITDENKNNPIAFGKDVINTLNTMLAAANSQKGLLQEIEKGVEIGLYDDEGFKIETDNGHPEYVVENFGRPILDGMSPDTFEDRDITFAKTALNQLHYSVADRFVSRATSIFSAPTLDTAAYLTLENDTGIEELEVSEGSFSMLEKANGSYVDNARRIAINFQLQQTDGDPVDSSLTMTYIEDKNEENYLVLFEGYKLPIGERES